MLGCIICLSYYVPHHNSYELALPGLKWDEIYLLWGKIKPKSELVHHHRRSPCAIETVQWRSFQTRTKNDFALPPPPPPQPIEQICDRIFRISCPNKTLSIIIYVTMDTKSLQSWAASEVVHLNLAGLLKQLTKLHQFNQYAGCHLSFLPLNSGSGWNLWEDLDHFLWRGALCLLLQY